MLAPTPTQRLLRALGRLPIPRLRGLYARIAACRDDTPREFQVPFAGLAYQGTLAQYVDRQIYYFGSYSPAELQFLAASTTVLKRRRASISFVDIGANVGQHSLFMARRADMIVAFEPNDEVADRLEANIRLNRLTNTTLVRTAVGKENTTAQLGSGLPNNSGSRSLTWSLDVTQNIAVEVVNGDEALRAHGVGRLDLLKIDVEGYEISVFEGLRETLRRDRPVILFELIGKDVKGGFGGEAHLREHLYQDAALFTLEGGSRPRLAPFDWSSEEAVCLPLELLPDFSAMVRKQPAKTA